MLVAAYPRSGSTWLRFMLYELLSGQPATFLAVNAGIPGVGRAEPEELLPGAGRLFMTHEPYDNVYRRGIYLVRDARDVLVSEYFFQQKVGAFVGSLDDFIQPFLEGQVNAYGSWHDHIQSWLDSPIAPDGLCVIRYEDLVAETADSLLQIGAFLGAEWRRDRIQEAVANNSVRRMRAKEEAADEREIPGRRDVPFIRKGAAGAWSEALESRAVQAIEVEAGDVLARLEYELVTRRPASIGDAQAVETRRHHSTDR